MQNDYLGKNIKKYGFGFMRLPVINEEIDLEQTKIMVDKFLDDGFTYFDTAYPYHNGKSEEAIKETLVKRHPRESYQLATKMPVWLCKENSDFQPLFDIQLERTGAKYFDFYLLHALDKDRMVQMDEIGGWDFIKSLKERGLIKHFGFSFHDTADILEQILEKHPETEFVQLQLNYADWNDEKVQSRLCYEVARKYNIPIIVMEPVKGGNLARLTPDIQKILKSVKPENSIASWAMRYVGSLDGVITILSGVSDLEQMEDNLKTMNNLEKLNNKEYEAIDNVIKEIGKIDTIPCTDCKYCVEDCPKEINIPGVLDSYNTFLLYGNKESAMGYYKWMTSGKGLASDCISCGICESHCPQHISIIEDLTKVAITLE